MKKVSLNPQYYMWALGVLILGAIAVQIWSVTDNITNTNKFNPPVVAPMATSTAQKVIAPVPQFHYIEIIDGCGPYYESGACVNVRSGPGMEFLPVKHLRTGVVLRVQKKTTKAKDGGEWYRIVFDKELRYPERVVGDWYVAVAPESVRPFDDVGDERFPVGKVASTTKRIEVSLKEETLYAYDGTELFMKVPISPGLELTPTAKGAFTIFYKTPSRYMQGPIPGVSDQEYDLPGVPWNMYITTDGTVIHGAYWHDHFGKQWSHGCINMSDENAKKLYKWAIPGTPVRVRD